MIDRFVETLEVIHSSAEYCLPFDTSCRLAEIDPAALTPSALLTASEIWHHGHSQLELLAAQRMQELADRGSASAIKAVLNRSTYLRGSLHA